METNEEQLKHLQALADARLWTMLQLEKTIRLQEIAIAEAEQANADLLRLVDYYKGRLGK